MDIHPAATFAEDVHVWPFSTICEGVAVGAHVTIGARCYVGRFTTIGEGTRVQDGAHLTDRMRIGRDVFIGQGVSTANDRHPRTHNPLYKVEPPEICDDASIGNGAVILPGVVIGRSAVIGAGAVVTRSVPAYETWVGNPARRLVREAADVTDGA